jgi:hypothetical protein
MFFGCKNAQTPSEVSQQSTSHTDVAGAHVGGLGASHHRELFHP